MEVKANRYYFDKAYSWKLENESQLANSTIRLIHKSPDKKDKRPGKNTRNSVFYFKAKNASNNTVSLDFAELNTKNNISFNKITYVITVIE